MLQPMKENEYVHCHRYFLSLHRSRQPQKYLSYAITLTLLFCAPYLFPYIGSCFLKDDPFILMSTILFRYAVFLSAVTSFVCYQDIIRDSIRVILEPYPIEGNEDFFWALIVHTISKTFPYCLSVLLLFVPMLWYRDEYFIIWIYMAFFFLMVWISSVFVGYAVSLGAIFCAKSPSMQPYLDLIRGNNPRVQAAFLYVPGVSLFCIGFSISFSSTALVYLVQTRGGVLMWIFFVSPLVLGLISSILSKNWMKTYYAEGSIVRNDIDAHWNILDRENQEGEDRIAYLEFLSKNSPELKRNLRQGWREFRIWAMGTWLLGMFLAFYCYQGEREFALQLALLASIFIAGLPTQLQQGDPLWLETQLPLPQKNIHWSRSLVAIFYAQGAIIPLLCVILILQTSVLPILLIEIATCLSAVVAANLPRYKRGFLIYSPIIIFNVIILYPFLT